MRPLGFMIQSLRPKDEGCANEPLQLLLFASSTAATMASVLCLWLLLLFL